MMPTLKPSRTNLDFTSLNVLVISRVSCKGSGGNHDCDSRHQDFPPTDDYHTKLTWIRMK